MLYTKDLNGWDAWGREYQNIPAFTPLAEEIYKRHGIAFAPLSPLSPGTNAVFASGGTVIKIYTPDQTGLCGKEAFDAELFSMRHAMRCGFSSPKVLASGYIDDKYRFYYIIMEHINAPEFREIRESLSKDKLLGLAFDFGQKLKKLNIPIESDPLSDVCRNIHKNKRWEKLMPEYKAEACRIAKEASCLDRVYVHGDLNGDNVLYLGGELFVIDFADSSLAPDFYESVCVITDLFDFDLGCAEAFTGLCGQKLADLLYNGLFLHEFGAEIILQNVKKRFGDDVVKSPKHLYKALKNWSCT